MMDFKRRVLAAGTVAAVFAGAVQASDIDIRLNGDFRGGSVGAATVQGWEICGKPGSSRIVQGKDRDEFGMALTAADKPVAATTGLIQVRGKYLEFKAKIRGTGQSAVIVRAFDTKRQPLSLETVVYHDPAAGTKLKFVCLLSEAADGFISISLAAMPGAKVIFEDVEAECRKIQQEEWWDMHLFKYILLWKNGRYHGV